MNWQEWLKTIDQEKWTTWALEFGGRILAALLILVIGIFVSKLVRGAVRRAMNRSSVDATVATFVSILAYYLMVLIVITMAITKLGVQSASIIAVIGAAGLAVGLALQGSLSNFASGVLLMLFRPFQINDFVEIAGKSGTVEELHIFTTTIRTADNREVIIPNAQITGNVITNFTVNDKRRVDLTVGIGYDDDIGEAKRILMGMLKDDSRVLGDPEPVVVALELGDNAVVLGVRPWVKTADYWPVFFDMQERIRTTLDAAGINIPFPQRDVHMYQANAVGN